MSERFDRGISDVRLSGAKSKPGFLGKRQNVSNIGAMLLEVRRVDDDVVNVNEDGLPLITTENFVHKALENARAVLESERHPFVLM